MEESKVWKNNKLVKIKYLPELIKIKNGIPTTLYKTGKTGKGTLPNLGPNHVYLLIITKLSKITNQLEYIGIADSNENIWNLPQIYNKGYEDMYIINKVIKSFINYNFTNKKQKLIEITTNEIWKGPIFADKRTTDNAWIEANIINFHLNCKELNNNLILINNFYKWLPINVKNSNEIYKGFLNKVNINFNNKQNIINQNIINLPNIQNYNNIPNIQNYNNIPNYLIILFPFIRSCFQN